MVITKIECIPIKFPLKHFCQGDSPIQKGYRMGYGEVPMALPVVIVQLHTSEGFIGIGDAGAITSLTYMPETPGSIVEVITDYFAPIILGENPLNVDKIMAVLDKRIRGNYLAKAAIDFALHDIVGKALNVPLYQVIGGLSAERIPLGWVMSAGTADELIKESLGAVKAGYRQLKVKTAFGTLEEDIENVQAVRSAVGGDIKICIDANAGWSYFQAKQVLKEVEKYNILYCEQPTPYWDVDALVTLRRSSSIPIVPDEACYGFGEILHLLRIGAADGLFIKVPKAGGIWKAKMWAALTKAAGIPLIVGEKLGGGIQVAAATHFACSTDWVTSAWGGHQLGSGLASMHGVYEMGPEIKDDVVKEVPKVKDGYLYPPTGPGLGIELNIEAIEKYRSGPNVVRTKEG